MSTNIELEMKDLNLNDKRLNRRCLELIKQFQANPQASIPSALTFSKQVKAAYRFFKNPKVSFDKILAPHSAATITRCSSEKIVLVVEDTTEMDFTDNSILQDLPRLDHLERRGFYCHTSLAINMDGNVLGIISNKFFERENDSIHKTRNYKQTAKEQKESYRWVEGIQKASKLSKKLENTKVVYVADRESDTFHCLYEAKKKETSCDIVIRSNRNRNTTIKIAKSRGKKFRKIYDLLEELQPVGQITFQTQGGHGKKSREVTQTIRYGTFTVKAPSNNIAEKYSDISINLIMVKEIDPPKGYKPVEWILWTTLPVDTIEEVLEIIKMYCLRYKIEVFFKFLKVYCDVEELKLIEASRLKACVTLYMIVAWRLQHIQRLAKSKPDEPCTLTFTELEWKVVYLWKLQKEKLSFDQLPKQAPTQKEFIQILGRLGGHLGRKGDGEIGPKSICEGYAKMSGMVEGWELCQKYNTYG